MIDANYRKFSTSLLPIFNGLTAYTAELQQAVVTVNQINLETENELIALKVMTPFLQRMTNWYEKDYPEWVLKRGFNRYLRSGFRYILLHLDEIMEAYLSLDYHLRELSDLALLQDIADQLIDVLENNSKMFSVIIAFFAAQPIDQSQEDFTSDVTDLYNIARSVLPSNIELLDLNPDYIHIASAMRDAVDIRQILLKILTALPIDDLAVKE